MEGRLPALRYGAPFAGKLEKVCLTDPLDMTVEEEHIGTRTGVSPVNWGLGSWGVYGSSSFVRRLIK